MIFIYITAANHAEAQRIAKHLLKKRLIACANMFPVESLYNWKGKPQHEKEFALIAKSAAQKYNRINKEVKKIHSYEIPLIAKINAKANREFESWVKKETK